jgi:putative nucleotidyltransferase with HDIG domain
MHTAGVSQRPARRVIFFALVLLGTSALSLFALLYSALPALSSPALQVGQVAAQDVLAPQQITYVSEALTEQQREAAERGVLPVYSGPETGVARQQLELLRNALAFITSVRGDAHASPEQKLADLAAMEDIRLSQGTAQAILGLSDTRWGILQQEAITVLEQVMRNTIRDDRLEDVRRSVPALVSLALTEEQADIVAELVAAFIVPNSLYNESLTQVAREKARLAVQPVTRSYMAGETVVRRGQVLTERDLEALRELGLGQPQFGWREIASAAILVLLSVSFMAFYLMRSRQLVRNLRGIALMALLFVIFLLAARVAIPNHTVIPYVFPLAAYSLIVAVLIGVEPALVTSLPLAVLTAYNMQNDLELTLYYLLGAFFGVLALGDARRITSFFWAGLIIAVVGMGVIAVYRLPLPTTDLIGLATLAGAAMLNGVASISLTMVLQFFLAQFLGTVTPIQLMEISRPDHPLLQQILRQAPGTYQHSLQVANLAEQAAELIEADTLLTRVGALYHDAGKTLNPAFFIENQMPGTPNPHDELDPASSAKIIIQHVPDGLSLARQHHLPRRILDCIREHHGTMITRYQYVKAIEAAGGDESQVDPEFFRYPGPRPQSRETAVLMLADGVEARVRAERPKNEDDLRALCRSVVDNRLNSGQLDDTELTLHDLQLIVDSFTVTLRGIYHPRLEYPKLEAVKEAALRPQAERAQKVEQASQPALAPQGERAPQAERTSQAERTIPVSARSVQGPELQPETSIESLKAES